MGVSGARSACCLSSKAIRASESRWALRALRLFLRLLSSSFGNNLVSMVDDLSTLLLALCPRWLSSESEWQSGVLGY